MAGAFVFFFFNDTATTEIYTLSLHDALPISQPGIAELGDPLEGPPPASDVDRRVRLLHRFGRSEEHTSELQSHSELVCRLLLEKKKKENNKTVIYNKKNK